MVSADNDFARCPRQNANLHVQHCPGALSSLCLWLRSLTLLAALNLLVTRQSRCQRRVGVIFSSERFCMDCPGSVCAWHHPTGLSRFSAFTHELCAGRFVITSKGTSSAHRCCWEISKNIPHFISVLPALPALVDIYKHINTSSNRLGMFSLSGFVTAQFDVQVPHAFQNVGPIIQIKKLENLYL